MTILSTGCQKPAAIVPAPTIDFTGPYLCQATWLKALVFHQSRYRTFSGVCAWKAIMGRHEEISDHAVHHGSGVCGALRFHRAGLESRQPSVRITAHDIHREVGPSTPVHLEVGQRRFERLI